MGATPFIKGSRAKNRASPRFKPPKSTAVVVIRPEESQTKESARRGASLSTVCCVAVCCLKHLLLRLLFETSAAPSVFVNICYESYHLLQKHLLLRLFS